MNSNINDPTQPIESWSAHLDTLAAVLPASFQRVSKQLHDVGAPADIHARLHEIFRSLTEQVKAEDKHKVTHFIMA